MDIKHSADIPTEDPFGECSLAPKFQLGEVVITTAAKEVLPQNEVFRALFRHERGDWGDVSKEDWNENTFSLLNEFRLLSSYKTTEGEAFWILTEADRSVTTILLPSEY